MESFGRDRPQAALFCNVHMLMLAQKDTQLAEAMEHSDLVFADGVPVAWLQARLGACEAGVLRGIEAVHALCAQSSSQARRVGLFGSSNPTVEALAIALAQLYPKLQIPYLHSPGYMEPELVSPAAEIADINAAGLDYLFVGLGCPKQEKWIHRYAESLNCSVLGVGAAFDWLAGTTPIPPRWMAKSGLGWLYRLLKEPKRLWKRYLIHNTAFMFAAAGALLQRRSSARAERGE